MGVLLINSYLLHCRHWAVLGGSYAGHKLKCTHSKEVEGVDVEGVRKRRSFVNDSGAEGWGTQGGGGGTSPLCLASV